MSKDKKYKSPIKITKIILLLSIVLFASIKINCTKLGILNERVANCECMEYWACAARNGHIFSYCGISEAKVCCFFNSHVTPLKFSKGHKLKINQANKHASSPNKEIESDLKTLLIPNVSNKTSPTSHLSKSLQEYQNDECGFSEFPVLLNFEATFGEWPWHVAVLQGEEDLYLCGGVLISRNKVITGAHCVVSYDKSHSIKVRAGEYDVSGNHETLPHIEVSVENIIVHPNFNSTTLENDIAILILKRDGLNYAKNIRPICLPRRNSRPGSKIPIGSLNKTCVTTGWGRISQDLNHSTVLKEVIVSLWSHEQCEERLRKSYGPKYHLPPSTICAGNLKTETSVQSICDGDGGGPLMCLESSSTSGGPSRWVHQGVVSFGVGRCGKPINDSLNVYTRVSSHLNWIKSYSHIQHNPHYI